LVRLPLCHTVLPLYVIFPVLGIIKSVPPVVVIRILLPDCILNQVSVPSKSINARPIVALVLNVTAVDVLAPLAVTVANVSV